MKIIANTSDLAGKFPADTGRAAALDTGAAANLVCAKWLERRNAISER